MVWVCPKLEWAKASYKSPHGIIVSHWELDGAQFRLRVTIPGNTTAKIILPTDSVSNVRMADEAQGVTLQSSSVDRVTYSVPSGSYEFMVQPR